MLKKQYLPKEKIISILNEYNIGVIKKIEPLATSGNISYIVLTDTDEYFLRISPDGIRWRSRGEIEAELELISFLSEKGIPVINAELQKNKETVIELDNKFGYLRKYNRGEEILSPDTKHLKKFGRILGKYHKAIEEYRTKNHRKHTWDLEETKKNFKQNKEIILKSSFSKKEEFIEKFEKEIFPLNFPKNLPLGTIHEDLGKRHVIWRKDSIIGIIDFDRCYFGKIILDLGQALRGWCFIDDWSNWSNKNFKAILEEYQKEKKLNGLEKEYLIDAVKFAVLERGLSFCLRFILVTQDPEDGDYAMNSVSENGFLNIIEKNRDKIEQIIKAA